MHRKLEFRAKFVNICMNAYVAGRKIRTRSTNFLYRINLCNPIKPGVRLGYLGKCFPFYHLILTHSLPDLINSSKSPGSIHIHRCTWSKPFQPRGRFASSTSSPSSTTSAAGKKLSLSQCHQRVTLFVGTHAHSHFVRPTQIDDWETPFWCLTFIYPYRRVASSRRRRFIQRSRPLEVILLTRGRFGQLRPTAGPTSARTGGLLRQLPGEERIGGHRQHGLFDLRRQKSRKD